MPHISDEAQKRYAKELVRLANERARLKRGLQLTWQAMRVPEEEQAKLLARILDGNQMEKVEQTLNCLAVKGALA